MEDRKHSIRKKYSLRPDEIIANGWDTYVFNEKNQVYIDDELICKTTVGNLDTYSRSITEPKVKEWLSNLKFGKKVSDLSDL